MDGIINVVKPYMSPLFVGEQARRILLLQPQHRVPISVAVALISTFAVYKSITKVPCQLAHIPHLGFFDYLKALLQRKTIADVSKNLTLPVAVKSDSGLYVRFDNNGWSVHIAHPEAAKKLLLRTDVFLKAGSELMNGTLLGRLSGLRHLGVLNGHEWKAQRKVANPAFHRSMPINLFGRLSGTLFKMMDNLSPQGEPIDFHDMMERWTLDALGLAAFDFDFHALEDKDSEWVSRYATVMSGAFDILYLMFPCLDKWLLPFNSERRHKHTETDKLLAMIDEIIVKKRKTLEEQKEAYMEVKDSEKDLLTLMLEAAASEEGVMSNEELRNNVVVFFIAGHDTTANAMSTAVYELAINPDVQSKAREEVMRVLGDTPEDVIPTEEQIREMPYIDHIIKENLRFHPPAPAILARKAIQDVELSGIFVPKGTNVVVDIYELHHNPKVWSDPETFRPERFIPGGEADQLASRGMPWLPFSNGARQCIGMKFSLAEQRVLLPMLLRKYEWDLPEDSIHKDGMVTGGVTMVTKPKDLEILFNRRY